MIARSRSLLRPALLVVLAGLVVEAGRSTLVDAQPGQSFQTALDAARRGDIIQLAAGASFTGPFELPDKGGGTGWVYVVSSALDRLPGPGNRLNPNLGGACGGEGALPCGVTPNASLADMPRIMSGGGRYRFIGIEFRTTPGEFVSVGVEVASITMTVQQRLDIRPRQPVWWIDMTGQAPTCVP